MNARLAARLIGVARAAAGVALLAVPERAVAGWVGPELAARPGVHALVRSLGARDLLLGLIQLHTAGHPEVAPRWQRSCAAVDLTDLAATVAAARDLPRSGVVAVGAIAGLTAAAELAIARHL